MQIDTDSWAEMLPQDCPPTEAYPPNFEIFFRLVDNYPPSEYDFCSPRKKYPNKVFYNVSECITLSCSLQSRYEECDNLRNLPIHKHQKVVQITLPPESGLIWRWPKKPYHFSWWRVKNFNPTQNCIEADPG
jgi:hypothetical protein